MDCDATHGRVHLVVIPGRAGKAATDHRCNKRIGLERRHRSRRPDRKTLDDRIRSCAECAVKYTHPLRKGKRRGEMIAVPAEKVLDAQMRHARMKEEFPLCRHKR